VLTQSDPIKRRSLYIILIITNNIGMHVGFIFKPIRSVIFESISQEVYRLMWELGSSALDLILSRDISGNSPFMTSLHQKTETQTLSKHFWNFIVAEAGLAILRKFKFVH